MPAVSKSQKQTACMALAMKRGKMKKTEGSPAAKMMEMDEQELVAMCGSKMMEEKK